MSETPQQAAHRFSAKAIQDGFVPEGLYPYRDADGNIRKWVIRLKHANGEKRIRPMRRNGHGYELGEPEFPNGKPLYRLPEIPASPDDPVWFVEGEICADALAKLGILGTTSGSADSAKHADFSPLAKRNVIIWPDNDEPGQRHAQEVAARLIELGATVRLVDVAKLNLPDKGDCVDWLEAHPKATAPDLQALPMADCAKSAKTDTDTRKTRAIEVADFLALELPPREHVLAPWLPVQGLTMIHAPRGVGKTHVALGVAYAVACGSTFLRWEAPAARGVLFVDGEMPARVLQERLANIIAASDREPAAPLWLITPDLQPLGMPDLSQPDGQGAIDAYIERIGLIIVDNISTLCRTGKENEAEGWLTVQGWALQHRAKGRSVLFIHHSGKGGAQRGTSKREDVLDTVIALKRPQDYKAEDGAAFEVHFEKARGFYGRDAEPFEARLGIDEHSRQCWTVRSLEDSTSDKIVKLLKEGCTQKDISSELGIARSTVNYHTKRAREHGRVSK
ncbi:MAG: AAA family ATPase [Gammaproteobacteria bacterium]